MPSRAVPMDSRSRLSRRLRTALVVALVLLPVAAFPYLGRALVVQDPLQHADAIVVLAGARAARWLEAVDLLKAGEAPRIVLSQGAVEDGDDYLAKRGITLPTDADLARDAMVKLGVAAGSIAMLPGRPDNTAAEAEFARELAQRSGWSRIIVVTSKEHTRRARLAFRRELAGTGIAPIVRASHYDDTDPDHWWRSRSTLRNTLFEWIKLIAYAGGLGA